MGELNQIDNPVVFEERIDDLKYKKKRVIKLM
jgi:hypothetical protein